MADRLTYLEPVVDSLREQCDRTDVRIGQLERDSREHWEKHTTQMHEMKIEINSELNNLKTEQRVHVAVVGLVIGILSFLGITIGSWVIKSQLDAVRQSITNQQK